MFCIFTNPWNCVCTKWKYIYFLASGRNLFSVPSKTASAHVNQAQLCSTIYIFYKHTTRQWTINHRQQKKKKRKEVAALMRTTRTAKWNMLCVSTGWNGRSAFEIAKNGIRATWPTELSTRRLEVRKRTKHVVVAGTEWNALLFFDRTERTRGSLVSVAKKHARSEWGKGIQKWHISVQMRAGNASRRIPTLRLENVVRCVETVSVTDTEAAGVDLSGYEMWEHKMLRANIEIPQLQHGEHGEKSHFVNDNMWV